MDDPTGAIDGEHGTDRELAQRRHGGSARGISDRGRRRGIGGHEAAWGAGEDWRGRRAESTGGARRTTAWGDARGGARSPAERRVRAVRATRRSKISGAGSRREAESVLDEANVDVARDESGVHAAIQQEPDRLPAPVAVVERPIVDVHADEGVRLAAIESTSI